MVAEWGGTGAYTAGWGESCLGMRLPLAEHLLQPIHMQKPALPLSCQRLPVPQPQQREALGWC